MRKTLEDIISLNIKNNIIEDYKNNVSIREISKKYGFTRPAITKLLENNNIKTLKGNHYKKYSFNYDYFEKIDTEQKAYWLGFLYADGCVLPQNRYGEQDFQLTLAQTDEQTIITFKNDLNSSYPIRYDKSKNNKNPNCQIQVIQKLRSQKTVNDLKRLGCVENKTFILQFPTEEQVPTKFIYDFIRGYFDGDGSFSISKSTKTFSIIGNKDFIYKLKDFIGFGHIVQDKRKINSYIYVIQKTDDIIKIYHLLYDNATRYMERKKIKIQLFVEKYNESQGI